MIQVAFFSSNKNLEYCSGFFGETPHTYPLIYSLLSATIYTWSENGIIKVERMGKGSSRYRFII